MDEIQKTVAKSEASPIPNTVKFEVIGGEFEVTETADHFGLRLRFTGIGPFEGNAYGDEQEEPNPFDHPIFTFKF